MKKTLLTALIVLPLISLTGCKEEAPNAYKTPKVLAGEWYQTRNGIDGVYMTASVSGSSIQVNMDFRDNSEIYWLGSFSGTNSTKGSYKIMSNGDSDAMALSLYGSGDKQKLFTYENGMISYRFTMQDETTTVYLKQQKAYSQSASLPTPKKTTKTATPRATTKPRTPAVKVPAAPAVKPPIKK